MSRRNICPLSIRKRKEIIPDVTLTKAENRRIAKFLWQTEYRLYKVFSYKR